MLAFTVAGLSVVDGKGVERVRDVSFEVRAGEIVGIAGVAGNGQSELLEALAGIRPIAAGRLMLHGAEITPTAGRDPREMRQLGLAHVPEDRQRMGLLTPFEVNESAILGYHDDPAYNGPVLMKRRVIVEDCRAKLQRYDIRPDNPRLVTGNFSGGNQQKVVLAREFERDPEVRFFLRQFLLGAFALPE